MTAAIITLLTALLPQGKDASEEARKDAIQIVLHAVEGLVDKEHIVLDVKIEDMTSSTRELHGQADLIDVGKVDVIGELPMTWSTTHTLDFTHDSESSNQKAL